MLIADPHHMGDPAQKVDQHMQQFSDSALRRAVPGILVFGEEAPMSQVLLSPCLCLFRKIFQVLIVCIEYSHVAVCHVLKNPHF